MSENKVENPVLEALTSRRSMRAFLDRPVDEKLIQQVLLAARNYPSSQNIQCVQVHVLSGEARDELAKLLSQDVKNGVPQQPDFSLHIPDHLKPQSVSQNAKEWGTTYFQHNGIDRDNVESRTASVLRNVNFFGAPVEIIISLPKHSVQGTFLDAGAFMQALTLACHSVGLGCCPQFSVGSRANVIKNLLGLEDRLIVCGVSVGWPDMEDHINTFVSPKNPLDRFVTFVNKVPKSSEQSNTNKLEEEPATKSA